MDIFKEDSDSDLEILEPEVLRKQYRHEELKLIIALSKYAGNQIPKKWEDFQIFVKNVVKFYLSPHLVRSVWVQLHACYQLAKSTNSCSFVEIIDEEGEEVIKKHKENKIFSNGGEVIHKGLKSGNDGKKSSNENLSSYIEIIDEDEDKSDVKQRNECLICTRRVIRERLKPGYEGDKSSNECSSDYIEIIDENEATSAVKQRNECLVCTRGVIREHLKPGNKGKRSINERSTDYVEIIDEDEATSAVKQKNECLIYTKEVVHKRSKPGNKGKKLSNEHSSHYLEIIDEDEEGKYTVKQKNEFLICTRGVIHEGLNPGNKGEKSSDEHSSDSVEIIDEDEGKSAVKQKNECLICTRGVIHEGLNPGNKGENSCDSSDSVELIDEERKSLVEQQNERIIYNTGFIPKILKPGNKGKKFSNEHSSHYVEIIDEEEGKSVVEQQNEHLIFTRGVIHEEKSIHEHSSDMVIIDEQILIQHRKRFINIGRVNCNELKPGDKGLKSNNELSSDYVNVIVDEEEEKKQILKQDIDEQLINTGVFNRELKSGDKRGTSNYYQLSDQVEISDEEGTIIVEGIDNELQYNVKEKKPNKDLSDCINISDEESKYGVKSIQQFNNIRGVPYGESKSEINGSTNTQLSDFINDKINDEKENTNSDSVTSNYFYKKIDIPKQIPERRFSMPSGRKRNRNGLRSSLPNSIEEAEAEALREKLLLDKIIELELPQVMKSFLNKNNVVSHSTKKRRKSRISTRESTNILLPDDNKSVSEIV